ncbi:hypothetical protein D9757_010235 [Collybiopsis confluens]|uniref:Uncharacterized protein n=1 Tax=Collybiopsis confluens TaxID=2823264 RepID=A0A8H5M3X6_9AGAR|nr:hypothetical protein D9757_010235 [Collybiopsis confluens]
MTTIFDSFPDITDAERASEFLYECLAQNVSTASNYSLDLCLTSLSIEPHILGTLRAAHGTRDWERIKGLCGMIFQCFYWRITSISLMEAPVYFRRNAWRFNPRLGEFNKDISCINVTDIVDGKLKRSMYVPEEGEEEQKGTDSTAEMISFIRNLQIPLGTREDIPLVILHKLGRFQDDPLLRERLDGIFSPSHHTFLVNTSGSGKTKLLFEGLCQCWGFYFTFAMDGSYLGPNDLAHIPTNLNWTPKWTEYLPPSSDPQYASLLQANLQLVHDAFCGALLARLFVFKLFLEACSKEGFCQDHRQRWLEAQLLPGDLLNLGDPFNMLQLDVHNAQVDGSVIDEAIAQTLEEIQEIWDMPSEEFLYIALDEANVPSREYLHAFADEHGEYPLLKAVIRSWQRRLGHLPVRFVVAGTVIPQEHFQSATGEWDNWLWSSDTGSFNNPESQRRYASQFLPPEFEASEDGQVLMRQMWHWLRGRHRYTASYLTLLLANRFESPLYLLKGFIQRLAKYALLEHVEYGGEDADRYLNWVSALGSNGLERGPISRIEMHRAVITYLATSKGCLDCETKDRALVTQDYGYFVDTECRRIALDEPLTIIYGAGWLKNSEHSAATTMFKTFDSKYPTPLRPSHFALFLALSFASNFDGFSNILGAFKIYGGPLFTALAAKLVVFSKNAEGRLEPADVHFSEHSPKRLVLEAGGAEDMLSWFKHERDEPFCLLQSSPGSSATLAFCLELQDGQCFWVFVHVPEDFTGEDSPSFAEDIQRASPTSLFDAQPEIISLLAELSNLSPDVGPLGVLRVSGSFRVEKASEDSIPSEHQPAAILNITSLEEAGKRISQDMLMRRLTRIFSDDTSNRPLRREQPQQLEASLPSRKGARRKRSVAGSTSTTRVSTRLKSKGQAVNAASGSGSAGPTDSKKRRRNNASSSAPTRRPDIGGSGPGTSNTKATARRRLNKITAVATGHATPGVPSPEPSENTSRYNLRKRTHLPRS